MDLIAVSTALPDRIETDRMVPRAAGLERVAARAMASDIASRRGLERPRRGARIARYGLEDEGRG